MLESRNRLHQCILITSLLLMTSEFVRFTGSIRIENGVSLETSTVLNPEEYYYEYEYEEETTSNVGTNYELFEDKPSVLVDPIMKSPLDITDLENNLDQDQDRGEGDPAPANPVLETTRLLETDPADFLQPQLSNDLSSPQFEINKSFKRPLRDPSTTKSASKDENGKEPIELQDPLDEFVKIGKRGSAGEGADAGDKKAGDDPLPALVTNAKETMGAVTSSVKQNTLASAHAHPTIPPQREFGPDASEGLDDGIVLERKGNEATILEDFDHTDFYLNCQDEKLCLGNRKKCTARKSCELTASYQPKPESDGVQIELLGKTSKYIAIGISNDTKMGEDNVVECVRENDHVRIYRSFNTGRKNVRLTDHSAISQPRGHFINDWLYCSFLLSKKTTIQLDSGNELTFDLEKDKFYLLIALGNTLDYRGNHAGIGYHDLGKTVSPEKYNLMVFGETRHRRLFERLHGVCIVLAWIFLLPVSTFVMRYFKNTCNGRFIGNLSVWFAAHVILNGVVIGLTIAAMILIMIPSQGSTAFSGWTQHNISALLFSLMVLAQAFLGIKIYGLRHYQHACLSCTHSILGHVIFVFSFYMVWTSMDIRHGLPCSSFPVLIVWGILYLVIHLIMSYQVCYTDFVQGAESSRIYSLSGLPAAPVLNGDAEPTGRFVRTVLLWALTGISFLAASVMIGMNAMGFPDCIREAENA